MTLFTATLVLRNDPSLAGPFELSYYQATPLAEQLAVSLAERQAVFGAAASDLAAIERHIAGYNVSRASSLLQGIVLQVSGTEADLRQAFPNDSDPDQLAVPQSLAEIVSTIVFNGFAFAPPAAKEDSGRSGRPVPNVPTPPQVAMARRMPAGAGNGQTIGVIENSGGYDSDDMDHYFSSYLGLPTGRPVLNDVSVDGGENSGRSGETYLDIQVAASIAYDATINVYFSVGGAQGLFDATAKAIDDLNGVITMSMGLGPEDSISPAYRAAYDLVLQIAACLGITYLHGCGDAGTYCLRGTHHPTSNDLPARVLYPSSSRWLTACGGSQLELSPDLRSIVKETVWNHSVHDEELVGATGGGTSIYQAVPPYQSDAGIRPRSLNPNPPYPNGARGIPDVTSMSMPGYQVYMKGLYAGIGGDSASGPFWAAMVAIVNANLGVRLGFLNPIVYKSLYKTAAITDITEGDNSYHYGQFTVPGYSAQAGYDLCSGVGAPVADELQSVLRDVLNDS